MVSGSNAIEKNEKHILWMLVQFFTFFGLAFPHVQKNGHRMYTRSGT